MDQLYRFVNQIAKQRRRDFFFLAAMPATDLRETHCQKPQPLANNVLRIITASRDIFRPHFYDKLASCTHSLAGANFQHCSEASYYESSKCLNISRCNIGIHRTSTGHHKLMQNWTSSRHSTGFNRHGKCVLRN